MLRRLRASGLLWPSAMALAALGVLLGLGTWQANRKVWKNNLQRQLDQRRAAEPVSLADVVARYRRGEDVEYVRVAIVGQFDNDAERTLYWPAPEGLGWHVYTLFRPDRGDAVFVNRGWVPDRLRQPAARAGGQIEGQTTVTGLVRIAERPGWFTPDNEPAANQWYWRDLEAMYRTGSGTDAAGIVWRPPFSIDTEARPANAGGFPRGGTTNLRLTNRHLEYALTWYGLAVTLIGVFFAFARGRWRAVRPAN